MRYWLSWLVQPAPTYGRRRRVAGNVSVARVTERAVNEKILEVEISGGICYNQDVAGETARMAGGDSKMSAEWTVIAWLPARAIESL